MIDDLSAVTEENDPLYEVYFGQFSSNVDATFLDGGLDACVICELAR